jgi:hypothetical protein
MKQLGLVGLGAGAAAALLFASATSGSWLSILLFYLAPLPIMIAGLGWSHWAAAVAAITGAVLAPFFGALGMGADLGDGPRFALFFIFLVSAGIPAWWLSYLALLARPAAAGANGGEPALEWYPTGRLVVWAAGLAALAVIIGILNLSLDYDGFRTALTTALKRMFPSSTDIPGGTNPDRLIAFLVTTIPPAAAVLATVTNAGNLWLAARVVRYSGLLKRPWPELAAISFPKIVVAALAAAILLSFAGGMIGIAAGVVSSSLTMAYGILGLAVVHSITLGIGSRPFLLGGMYASIFIFGWPILVLCLLGIAETGLELRARAARRRAAPPRT